MSTQKIVTLDKLASFLCLLQTFLLVLFECVNFRWLAFAPLCHKSQNGFWYTRAKLTF